MAFDPTKPVNAEKPALSAPIRANWDAIQRTLGGINLIADSIFEIWPGGDAVSPSYFTLAGAGAAIARAGTGLGDTNRKVGKFCAKITAGGGAVATHSQRLLTTTSFDDIFDNQLVSAGAWVRSNSTNGIKLGISDGFGTSFSAQTVTANTWTWVSVSRQIAGSATHITIFVEIVASQIGYWSGPVALIGEVPPGYWHPGATRLVEIHRFIAGLQTVGTRKVGADFFWKRPWIVRSVQCMQQTAPVVAGANYIIDVNHFDGSVFQSMYSTRPQIVAGGASGSPAAPDSTYRYRCFEGLNTNSQTDRVGSIDVDQIGSTQAGTDIHIIIHGVSYDRPLESLLAHNETN